jgi:hypothetical protein
MLEGFPELPHDDDVDAVSRAFQVVGLGQAPVHISPEAMRRFGPKRPGMILRDRP